MHFFCQFQVKHVVLINCGANFDIIEALQPEEFVKFYICDRFVLYLKKYIRSLLLYHNYRQGTFAWPITEP